MKKKTIADLVVGFPQQRAGEKILIFLDTSGQEVRTFTFGSLRDQCVAIAENLLASGLSREIVLLSVDDQADFVISFFGCILAGFIPAPLPAPRNAKDRSALGRMVQILKGGRIRSVFAGEQQTDFLQEHFREQGLKDIRIFSTALQRARMPGAPTLPELRPEDIAYIQYTSGSTSAPKGVVLHHGQVCTNLAYIDRVCNKGEPPHIVGWTPFHHDMGLVGHLFAALYSHGLGVFMPARAFLASPQLWLDKVSQYRANLAAVPTFTFDYCTRKAQPTPGMDLSNWRYLFVGAETVSVPIMNAFAKKFAAAGFDRNAFRPVYGMAEATLLVAGALVGLNELDHAIRRKPVAAADGNRRNSQPAGPAGNPYRELPPYLIHPEMNISILDPQTGEPCAPGEEGEICLQGASNTIGYFEDLPMNAWMNPPRNHRPTRLNTGDLGFVRDGFLYVTGRCKDMVIVRGINYSAEDLEQAIRQGLQDPALLRDGDQTVCVGDIGEDRERLYVFQEVQRHTPQETMAQIADQVGAALAMYYGIVPDKVILLPNGCIPRTRNYKISRVNCLRQYRAGELPVLNDALLNDAVLNSIALNNVALNNEALNNIVLNNAGME